MSYGFTLDDLTLRPAPIPRPSFGTTSRPSIPAGPLRSASSLQEARNLLNAYLLGQGDGGNYTAFIPLHVVQQILGKA